MKNTVKLVGTIIIVMNMCNMSLISMEEQGSSEEGIAQQPIDLTINLLNAVNNYRVHCGTIKQDNSQDPLTVFRTFMWRNANDLDMVLIGPSNDKQLLRYASLRLALQTCIRNNTLTYDEILHEVRNYGERYH